MEFATIVVAVPEGTKGMVQFASVVQIALQPRMDYATVPINVTGVVTKVESLNDYIASRESR